MRCSIRIDSADIIGLQSIKCLYFCISNNTKSLMNIDSSHFYDTKTLTTSDLWSIVL